MARDCLDAAMALIPSSRQATKPIQLCVCGCGRGCLRRVGVDSEIFFLSREGEKERGLPAELRARASACVCLPLAFLLVPKTPNNEHDKKTGDDDDKKTCIKL